METPAISADRPEYLAMENIARTLTVALGERDPHTRHHCERVIRLAAELGSHIRLDSSELKLLSLGARFHDIGKIGVPDRILGKPAPYEADEWIVMKQHPLIGERIIMAIGASHSPKVAQAVRHHHENYDGSGYPDGLAGEAIPLLSRVISLVDNYDAMAEQRPYHKARRHSDVMDVMHREVGTKHDPELMRAFSAMIEKSDMRVRQD